MDIASKVAQRYQKTSASVPTLAKAKQDWALEAAKAIGDYWSRVGGGWKQFNIKVKNVSPRHQTGALVELEADGWGATVAIIVAGGLKVTADLFVDGEDSDDLLAVLTEAAKDNFEKVYSDTTNIDTIVKDVSLHFSKLTDKKFGR